MSRGQSARRPVLRGPQDDVADGGPDGHAVRAASHPARPPRARARRARRAARGPTPPKARNPLGAGMPAGFPDLSNMPKGLDELPPGLADIDLSKLKFPPGTSDERLRDMQRAERVSRRPALHVRGRGLPEEEPVEWWIVDGTLSAEPVSGAETVFGADGTAAGSCPAWSTRTATSGSASTAPSNSTRRSPRPRPNATPAHCCCAMPDHRSTPAASTTATTCPASSARAATSPGPSATSAASRSNWTTSPSCPMRWPNRRGGATAG